MKYYYYYFTVVFIILFFGVRQGAQAPLFIGVHRYVFTNICSRL